MTPRRFVLIVLLLLQCFSGVAQTDTASVFFAFDVSTLDESSKFFLDSLIYQNALSAKEPLQIIGYTDAVGGDDFNLRLSKARAASVKSCLMQSGFRNKDITLVIGKGELQAKMAEQPGGYLADRRVDIVQHRPPAKPVVRSRPQPLRPVAAMPAEPRLSASIDLGAVKVGQTVVLENIYFYAGRHIVRKESDEALEGLVEALKEHPEIKIRIEGHVCCIPGSFTDAIDDDTGKEQLSANRAKAVRDYLVAHGIDAARLSSIGFGHRYPVVTQERNEDDANRNRRVEIRVIE